MAPGLRSGEKGERNDDVIIAFLKSSEFMEIVRSIAEDVTNPLKEEIKMLKEEVHALRQTNDNLVKEFQLKSEITINHENINTSRNAIDKDSVHKVTYADKLNSGKKAVKKQDLNTGEKEKIVSKNNEDTLTSSNTGSSTNIRSEIKRYRKSNIIYGTAESNCNIKAVAKYAHLHVYRLDPKLSLEEMDDYLKSQNISNAKLEKLPSKRPEEYSSFRVSVPMDIMNDVKNPSLWPKDACINRFFFHRPKKDVKI